MTSGADGDASVASQHPAGVAVAAIAILSTLLTGTAASAAAADTTPARTPFG